MSIRPVAERAADYLIRRACRRLPEGRRDERYREWTAELFAILHDSDIRFQCRRRARGFLYAADLARGTQTLRGTADDITPTMYGGLASFRYGTDLRPVRAFIAERGTEAGLSASRLADLMVAASEAVANTVRHTNGPGTVVVWRTNTEIVCQIEDSGWIRDPLAGQRGPAADQTSGLGLWVIRQLCDQVEISSNCAGTTIRLHMDLRTAETQGPPL